MLSDALARPARSAPAESLKREFSSAHLRKAESQVLWLRWVGMAGWALVLLGGDGVDDPVFAWTVFSGGLAYTLLAHWWAVASRNIGMSARVTTVCDPVLVTLMCLPTGGLSAAFFPFYYFTQMAAAFRFGRRGALYMLALNLSLVSVLYLLTRDAGATPAAIGTAAFHMLFASMLGLMLADWADENLELALSHMRALTLARDRSQRLLHRLIEAQEAERKRIAGTIHDRMSGLLFALRRSADRLAQDGAQAPADREAIAALSSTVDQVSRTVRTMMNELHPNVLDELGFCAALEEYVENAAAGAPFEIAVEVAPELRSWRSAADSLLFRIVQEALLNTEKHADAGHVGIHFHRRTGFGETGEVVLEIADDGIGFDPESEAPGHLGLMTMRERAEALGGRFKIDTEPGAGTRIRIILPTEGT